MDGDTERGGHNLLLLIELAYKRLDGALMEHLRTAGFDDLRAAHSQVFGAVAEEGSRIGEMAAQAGITQQSMSELVDSLERLGYLERRSDPRDRRAKLVMFTERGWDAVRAGVAAVDQMERTLADRIGRQRANAMRAGLEDLATDGGG